MSAEPARLALLDGLEQRCLALPGNELPWLAASRRRALAQLTESGLPREREERWKYTSLAPLSGLAGDWANGPDAAFDRDAAMARIALPGLHGPRLVWVDGRVHAGLSRLGRLPEGVELWPLSEAIHRRPQVVQGMLSRSFHGSAEGFATLNAACASEGMLLRVAAGVRVAEPIHVVHLSSAASANRSAHLRLLVDIGEDAECRFVEHYAGDDPAALLLNVVTQLRLAPSAVLRHLRLQDAATQARIVQRSEADLHTGATWRRYDIELGALWLRHDLVARLQEPGAAFESFGLFALRGRQHLDTHLRVDHLAADCRSDCRWRGVADGRARGVFDGQISVHAGADGSDAALANNNLLLSPQAEIDSRPVLEIEADDVKAAHGATVGQLDERALFYLRSRGIPKAEARSLLTYAFCREVFDRLALEPLRRHLAELLVLHLPRQPQEAG